jgi:hypothetical protein
MLTCNLKRRNLFSASRLINMHVLLDSDYFAWNVLNLGKCNGANCTVKSVFLRDSVGGTSGAVTAR